MADLKISQLSAATALAGTEVVPVVQGGSTKKATIDQILAPASGKGINFAAAGGDTLTIYDEGTFTPVVVGTSTAGTATYSAQSGKYTRIGRLVTVEIYLNWSGGTGTGSLQFGGLPFAVGSNGFGSAAIWAEIGLTALNYLTTRLLAGSSTIDPFNSPVGGGVTNPVAYQAGGSVMITATYSV